MLSNGLSEKACILKPNGYPVTNYKFCKENEYCEKDYTDGDGEKGTCYPCTDNCKECDNSDVCLQCNDTFLWI